MSFSSKTKEEICKLSLGDSCCCVAEAYGALLFCNTFSTAEIRIITESAVFVQRLKKLFRRAFSLSFDLLPPEGRSSGKQMLAITDTGKIRAILRAYGYEESRLLSHHINLGVLEECCCQTAFVRGAFLAGGSVTDPEKRYHLELVTDHYKVSLEMYSLLLDLGFAPKQTARGGNYITYFKNSEVIEDFLTTVGAPLSAMEIMSAKVEKELRNSVNRRVNCDTANVEKTVAAAQNQVEAIQRLQARGALEDLPEKLAETARLRLEKPESSLSELASQMGVTKSCLSHRLRKLVELAR